LSKSLNTFKTDNQSRVVFPIEIEVGEGENFCDNLANELNTKLAAPREEHCLIDRFEFTKRRGKVCGKNGIQERILDVLIGIVALVEKQRDKDEEHSSISESWQERLPKFHWERHGNLLMLPHDPCFKFLQDDVGFHQWNAEAKLSFIRVLAPDCNRLAIQHPIQGDGFRTPRVDLVFGESSVVQHKDNGVLYEYDVRKCMFSSGNVTEKMRVARFDCEGEVVVDLFAGIGYFTLPYLVHAKAKHVYACEWNPDSIEALKRNLQLNGVQDRCTVLPGDNRATCPAGVAHRLNLGLLPSAEASFSVAARALKKPEKPRDARWVHIHANVDRVSDSDERASFSCNKLRIPSTWIQWAEETKRKFQDLLNQREKEEERKTEETRLEEEEEEIEERTAEKDENARWNCAIAHIEYVKSYGPKVDHLVLDLKCQWL